MKNLEITVKVNWNFKKLNEYLLSNDFIVVDKYDCYDIVLISPRGRASIWLNDLGTLKVYTDKTITDYYKNQDLSTLHTSYVTYQKEDKTYYCSSKLNNILPFIPDPISDECSELIEIIRKTKVQRSHSGKTSSNIIDEPKETKETKNLDNFFGLFDEDGED